MTPDHIENAKKAIGYASSLPNPTGARCKNCSKVIKDPDAPSGFCCMQCSENKAEDLSQGTLRKLVEARDRGKCFACSNDTKAIREELDSNKRMAESGDARAKQFMKNRLVFWAMAGFTDAELSGEKLLWEAHHLHERAAGGGNTLANMATACTPCHARLSGDFSRARAKARKPRRRISR